MAIFSKLYEVTMESTVEPERVVTVEESLEAAEIFDQEVTEATEELFEAASLCFQDMLMLQEALMVADITIDEEAIQYVREAAEEGKDAEEAKKEAGEKAEEKTEEVKKSFGEKAKAVVSAIVKKIEELFNSFVTSIKKFFNANVLKTHPELAKGEYELKAGLSVNAEMPDLDTMKAALDKFVAAAIDGGYKKEDAAYKLDELKKVCKVGSDETTSVDDAFVKNCVVILENSDKLISEARKAKDVCVKAMHNIEGAETTANQMAKAYSIYIGALQKAARLANATLWKVVGKNEDADNLAGKMADKADKAKEKRQDANAKEGEKQAKANAKAEAKADKENEKQGAKEAKAEAKAAKKEEKKEKEEGKQESVEETDKEKEPTTESTSYSDLFNQFLNGQMH